MERVGFFGVESKKIAIVGAGMAGIACARDLRSAGLHPVVFEKSRGLGGRMATRRVDGNLAFDHGVQYVTAGAAAFQQAIHDAVDAGSAAAWQPRGCVSSSSGSEDWIAGAPAMNALIKPWSAGLDLRFSCQVKAIEREGEGWCVSTDSSQAEERFDGVVLAIPAPQAAALVSSEPRLADALAGVSIAPCWATMLAFEQPLETDFDVWRSDTDSISWLARNGSKPQRNSAKDCWVVHAGPEWSRENLELEREQVLATMLEMLPGLLGGPLPEIAYATAHRWRYAMTETLLGQAHLSSDDGTLLVGGDWCLGARVESAFDSGVAMAQSLIHAFGREPA